MSALSDLVYGKNNERGPWPHFTDKYPVKIKTINEKAIMSVIINPTIPVEVKISK